MERFDAPPSSAARLTVELYNHPRVVEAYAGLGNLSPGENAILERLRLRAPFRSMLEIGVGAGRVSREFASLADSYVGIDVARAMVEECRSRYPRLDFRMMDVCDMRALPEAGFDCVLFSFNGIDCMDGNERAVAFAQMRRVLAPGGVLVFSAHNLSFLRPAGLRNWMRLAPRPRLAALVLRRKLAIALRRRGYIGVAGPDRAMLRETQLGVEAHIVYTTPDAQARELIGAGFGNVDVYSNIAGKPVTDPDDPLAMMDPWLYYCCERQS